MRLTYQWHIRVSDWLIRWHPAMAEDHFVILSVLISDVRWRNNFVYFMRCTSGNVESTSKSLHDIWTFSIVNYKKAYRDYSKLTVLLHFCYNKTLIFIWHAQFLRVPYHINAWCIKMHNNGMQLAIIHRCNCSESITMHTQKKKIKIREWLKNQIYSHRYPYPSSTLLILDGCELKVCTWIRRH